ncbi:hypothetical protein AAHA92_06737 [Salvia divinorum]|uniref:Maturase K n=1 Tax=Salvia divinorum TaxID=28513 RepID=A0ABD1I7E8_SALDI
MEISNFLAYTQSTIENWLSIIVSPEEFLEVCLQHRYYLTIFKHLGLSQIISCSFGREIFQIPLQNCD